ncbi:hypothetical protein, partial [Asticcacaulis biprosthecium]|uniref:hypothetical protein n=1 Tax=Asticcacaulis biprosthecium TaxID=76891 RepID=UPI00058B992C
MYRPSKHRFFNTALTAHRPRVRGELLTLSFSFSSATIWHNTVKTIFFIAMRARSAHKNPGSGEIWQTVEENMISKMAKKAAPLLALAMVLSLASVPSYSFAGEKEENPRVDPGLRGGDGGNRGGGNRGGGNRGDGGGNRGGSAPAPR